MTFWCVGFSAPYMTRLIQERALHRYAVEIYYPIIHFSVPRAGRRRAIEEDRAAFPGYVFVKQQGDWEECRELDGFRGFLSRELEVVRFSEQLIEDVKFRELNGDYEEIAKSVKIYEVGAPVRIECGLLAGVEGIIVKIKRKKWAFVQIGKEKPMEFPRKNLLLI